MGINIKKVKDLCPHGVVILPVGPDRSPLVGLPEEQHEYAHTLEHGAQFLFYSMAECCTFTNGAGWKFLQIAGPGQQKAALWPHPLEVFDTFVASDSPGYLLVFYHVFCPLKTQDVKSVLSGRGGLSVPPLWRATQPLDTSSPVVVREKVAWPLDDVEEDEDVFDGFSHLRSNGILARGGVPQVSIMQSC